MKHRGSVSPSSSSHKRKDGDREKSKKDIENKVKDPKVSQPFFLEFLKNICTFFLKFFQSVYFLSLGFKQRHAVSMTHFV